MILKAGTYRFNDVINTGEDDWSANINFRANITPDGTNYADIYCDSITFNDGSGSNMGYNIINMIPDYSSALGVTLPFYFGGIYKVIDGDSNPYRWQLIGVQTITLDTDQTVTEEFGTWYIANTNYNEVNAPLVTIEYNGSTIAELNAGETATLSCEGKKMTSDVVVKVNKVEEPVDDSIVGTWVFKDELNFDNLPLPNSNVTNVYFPFYSASYGYFIDLHIQQTNSGDVVVYYGSWKLYFNGAWDDDVQTITIYNDVFEIVNADFTSEQFKTWLKANATKQ